MRVRQLSILMLAGLALVAACGSSDNSSTSTKSTSTTSSTPPSSAGGATTTTKPKVSFAAGLPQMQQTLAAAKGDACKLYEFSNDLANVENPANAEENKQAADILATYFNAIADVMKADHASAAEALRTETAKFTQQVAAADYKLDDPSVTALNDKGFQESFATFQQETSSCATTTTVGK